jgi:hypothetical protein
MFVRTADIRGLCAGKLMKISSSNKRGEREKGGKE